MEQGASCRNVLLLPNVGMAPKSGDSAAWSVDALCKHGDWPLLVVTSGRFESLSFGIRRAGGVGVLWNVLVRLTIDTKGLGKR